MADREYISAEWLRQLQARDIPFAVRLCSDRQIGITPAGPALPGRMFARGLRVGEERVLCGRSYLSGADGEHVAVRVVMRRIASACSGANKNPFLILSIWETRPSQATALYRKRWEILALFAALKSRGFQLEKTHLTAPKRVERLIDLLALAFAWSHLVGEKRAQRHGSPPVKSHGRPERSLFLLWTGCRAC